MRITGTLGVCGAACALGAVVALAGEVIDPNQGDDFAGVAGKFRYSQDAALADSGSFLLAGCGPQTRHLVGGGEVVSGAVESSYLRFGRGYDYNDADLQPDDGWYAGGAGPPGAAVTASAICRKGPGVRYRTKTDSSGASDQPTLKLGCGGRRWHVTSGSPFVPTTNGWINSSHPFDGKDGNRVPDDGWRARVFSGQASAYVSISAICARNAELRYVKGSKVNLGTGTPSRSQVSDLGCGATWHVVGGGARLSGLINRARMSASAPIDAGDADAVPDDRWHSAAYNLGGLPIEMTGFAICGR